LDDAVEGAASPRILPRVGGNKDGTCTPSTFRTSGRTKTRKTSGMKNGLLFDPFAVVFEVVVIFFYASLMIEKSGENSIDFHLSCPHYFGANDEERTYSCCRYKEDEDEDERFLLCCSRSLCCFRIFFLTLSLFRERYTTNRRWGKNASPPSTCARKCPA